MSVVKQLSVFLENKPGRLAAVTEKLYEAGINIQALTIAEAGDFGIIRMIVDDVERAYDILKKAGFVVSLTDVLVVELEDEPGSLYKIAKALGDNNINIEYVYAFTHRKGKALKIMKVDDLERALKVLESIKS